MTRGRPVKHVETDELLARMYRLVKEEDMDTHIQLCSALGISRNTLQRMAILPGSRIHDVIAQAKEDRATEARRRIGQVARDPSHRRYYEANTFIAARHDRVTGANKVTVIGGVPAEVAEMSADELERIAQGVTIDHDSGETGP